MKINYASGAAEFKLISVYSLLADLFFGLTAPVSAAAVWAVLSVSETACVGFVAELAAPMVADEKVVVELALALASSEFRS